MDMIEGASLHSYPTQMGAGGVPEPSRRWVLRQFREVFRFADSLGVWVRRNLPDVYSGDPHAPHVVPTLILIRMSVTFAALVRLCEGGYGDQAMMLYRSMFEDMLVAHWVAEDPERAEERLRKQDRHGEILMLDEDVFGEHGFEYEPSLRPPTPDERRELGALFGEHGERNLTGKNLWVLVNETAPKLREREAEELRSGYAFLVKVANRTLHTTADTLRHAVTPLESGDAILGQPNMQVSMPLFAATWCLYRTASLILEQLQVDRAELDRLYWRGRRAFDVSPESYLTTGGEEAKATALAGLDAMREALDGTRRDDPCPCGSPFTFGGCCREDYAKYLWRHRKLHMRLRSYVDGVLASLEPFERSLPED
jgi:Family of unknown function (DUF5677)